jgi:hypothetical protein
MKDLCKDFARVTRYICNLHGGSQPILAQACDGLLYVVKFANNLQGFNLPFNECIGTELYHACGLAVPSWRPLLVTDSFLDQNPDCWMQAQHGRLRPNSGLCFGSRFLGGNGIRVLEILSETSFKRVRNRLRTLKSCLVQYLRIFWSLILTLMWVRRFVTNQLFGRKADDAGPAGNPTSGGERPVALPLVTPETWRHGWFKANNRSRSSASISVNDQPYAANTAAFDFRCASANQPGR